MFHPRLSLFVALALCAALHADAPLDYPASPVEPVDETLHGRTVTDPYRYLEGDEQGRLTERVARWTDAQNALTRRVLDGLPGRAALEARLAELMEVGYTTAPAMRGNRYFYRKRSGKQAQAVVMMRVGVDGEPRVLINPNTLDAKGLLTVGWIAPSHDGRLLAFGTYRAGDEITTLHLLDVDTGEWLADEIPGKARGVYWLPDNKAFVYRRLADVANPYSAQIKLHRVGTHHRHDPVLFEQYKQGPLATTWGPGASLSRDGRWLVLTYSTSTSSNDVWVVDFDRYRRTGEFVKTEVVVGEKASSWGPVVGDTLYLHTDLDAPNGRVVAVDLHRPGRQRWRTVIAEREGMVLGSVSVARGVLVAQFMHHASTRLEKFDLAGEPLGAIELPNLGSASVTTAQDRTEAFLTFSSFNTPYTVYRIDLKTGERVLWDKPDVPVDPSIVDVKQVWFKSKDGTRVPMFVVHKKGLKLDGANPTILAGYGGFGISLTPRFSSTRFPWLEGGGVYAVVNLRGGGEFGKAWHEAGKLDRKQNVFDDFIAAAEWLVENKYTSPAHLGVSGGSNGGLLTGAVAVQRPDLFAAVISDVPLLDMIRYQRFLMARYWVPEYGSSEDAAQFAYLLKYSPYHNVEPTVRYPAMFITAGENDTRVHPLHARKFAALMQSVAQAHDDANPVLLWVDRDSGHGGGKPLNLRIRDVADARLFMMWRLGMLDGG